MATEQGAFVAFYAKNQNKSLNERRSICIKHRKIMKSHFFLMMAALLPCVVAAPLPEKAELLASNTVVAQYVGTESRPCYGRTMLCPDRCGHAVSVAKFRVLNNEAYEKPGKYGDDKAAEGNMILVDAKNDVPGQSEDMLEQIANLKPGQIVRLTQKHYYAEMDGVHMPIRPVTQLDVLKDGACEEILPEPKDPANHDHEVMPLPL